MKVIETPLMKQYAEMKKKHPDAILLFRVGDFYETFSDDAIVVSEICGVTLTRRYNGKSTSIELAGFPHHALDTYLPKMVRAGKRVAICEQIEDNKQKLVEKVTPGNQDTSTDKTNKTEKKMDIKKINCNLSDEELRKLGEPLAYFAVEIPKEVKNMGKYTQDPKEGHYTALQSICLEPEVGKLLASDTRILYVADARCEGIWPEVDENGNLFQCYIDPKVIRELAGKTVDVAVWHTAKGKVVTACESEGVLAQHVGSCMGMIDRFPKWDRVIPRNNILSIKIAPKDIKPLRDFVKSNMGKIKSEVENRYAVIDLTPEADDVRVTIKEGDYDESREVASASFDLCDGAAHPVTHYAVQSYNARLFYYSILEDFNGEILFAGDLCPATFKGESRTSILMPKAPGGLRTYMTTDISEADPRPMPEAEPDLNPTQEAHPF